ncbi:MAG: flagellar basal-body rod protein FlgG [Gammaproteobacteria bacterium]|nr:flagellar basal-body rod protein FlgG [Gammaproteobacteria bacterium]
MNPALWVAKTGLDSQQTRLQVVANNLANASTTGFKKDRAVFEDLIYQNYKQPGAQSTQDSTLPSGLLLGTGVRVAGTQKMHLQGGFTHTGNSLDLAIQGQGFFQVLRPDGTTAYTRDGEFQINEQGQVVTNDGYLLQPGITIPANSTGITIGTDGTVSVVEPGNGGVSTQVGQIETSEFVNSSGLFPIGENQFQETLSSGAPTTGLPGLEGRGALLQGSLESSNVNTVEELVTLIETQRTFEMNSKSVSTADKMMSYFTNNV